MANYSIDVIDSNNIIVEVTPTSTTEITIDRGVVGASGQSGYSGYSGFSGAGISGASGI
jgi:hypothetical protein